MRAARRTSDVAPIDAETHILVSPRLRAEGDCYRERNNDAECGARPDQQGCLPGTHDHRPTAMLRPERDIVSANGSDLQGWQLVGFTPDKMVLRLFKWDFKTQTVDEMDTLQPLHVTELARPG